MSWRVVRGLYCRRAILVLVANAYLIVGTSESAERSGAYYYYWDKEVPLSVDSTRVAIYAETLTAKDVLAALNLAGVPLLRVTPHEVRGWYLASLSGDRKESARKAEKALPVINGCYVSPVYMDGSGQDVIVTPELLIGLRDARDLPAISALLKETHGASRVEGNWPKMPGLIRARWVKSDGTQLLRLANSLAKDDPRILFAEPDMIRIGTGSLVPSDPLFSESWALHNTGQPYGPWQCVVDQDLDAPEAWDVTTGSPSVTVLVLDDGVDQSHPDLNLGPGRDFTGEESGGGPVNRCDNHGTGVAGCVSELINNIGTVGIAPGCPVASARIGISNQANPCDNTIVFQNSWLVDALAWGVDIGARVTNCSYQLGPSSAIDFAYNATRLAGQIHFAAAGNYWSDPVAFPASGQAVNAVSGVSCLGEKMYAWGDDLDFTAPSAAIITTDRVGIAGYGPEDYITAGGTSLASPYAAGVAALVLSAYQGEGSLSPDEVEEILRATCDVPLGETGGWNPTWGWGIVNAGSAVRRSFCGEIPPEPSTRVPVAGSGGLPSSVHFDWNDVAGAVRYVVRIECNGVGQGLVASVVVVESEFNLVLPDGSYRWSVSAQNRCNQGVFSDLWDFSVGTGINSCAVPVLLEPADGSVCLERSVVLQWEPIPGATGYVVGIDHGRCGGGEEFFTTEPRLNYTDSGMSHHSFYWRVKEDCVCSVFSDCFRFETREVWDKVPTLMSPGDGSDNVYTMGGVEWNNIAEADSYRVQLGTSCGEGTEYDVVTPELSYEGLAPYTTYFWRVRAKGSGGECPQWAEYSDCFSFTTAGGTNRVYLADDLSIQRGQMGILVPVRGENIAELREFKIEVEWDRDVLEYAGWTLDSTRAEGAWRVQQSGDSNTFYLDVTYPEGGSCPGGILAGDGELFCLVMNIRGNAPLGATAITVTRSEFKDCSGNTRDALALGGSVEITGSGIDQYYFPSGMTATPGQEIVVPVRAENLLQLKEYQFRLTWDRDIFEYVGYTLDGTRGENPKKVDVSDGSDNVRVRVQLDCPPGIPSGDGECARILLRTKDNAPIGTTTLNFDPSHPSETYFKDCVGHTVTPPPLGNGGDVQVGSTTGVRGDVGSLDATALELRAVPNPLSRSTQIHFYLPGDMPVELSIYDIAGRQIVRLADEHMSAGWHTIGWNGLTSTGQGAASGVYFVRLRAVEMQRVTRIVLSRR